jgi:hypothetical protein
MEVNKPMVNFMLIFLSLYIGLVWENTNKYTLRYLIYLLLNVVIVFSVIMFNRLFFMDMYERLKDKLYGRNREEVVNKEDEVKKFIE